ncbi:MAG: glycosyltransferase family 39 protein [Candidatus Zixiibacteriota bacterium]
MPVRSDWLVRLLGLLAVMVGAAALFAFDFVKQQLLFLSADGVVEPHSFLQLQILLVSAGIVGVYLFFHHRLTPHLQGSASRLSTVGTSQFLIWTLGLAALFRTLVVMFLPVVLWADSLGYHDYAVTWARVGSYMENGLPTAVWPPAWPWLLSRLYLLFGELTILGAIVNALLGLGTCLLSYLTVRRLFNERAARVTLVLMAIFPSQVLFLDLLVSEYLFTFLLWLGMYVLIRVDNSRLNRFWFLVGGGIVLGLAMLTRSLIQLLPLVFVPYWWMRNESLRSIAGRVALVVVGMALVVTPWIIRNYHHVGVAAVSSNGGINFYIGNNPRSGIGWLEVDTTVFLLGNPAKEAGNNELGYRLGWQYIAGHPAAFVKRGILKVAYTFASDIDAIVSHLIVAAKAQRTDFYVVAAVVMQSVYLIALLWAALGIWHYYRQGSYRLHPGGVLLVLVVLYWMAVHFVFFGCGRFHFPLIPIIAAFASLYLATDRSGSREVN